MKIYYEELKKFLLAKIQKQKTEYTDLAPIDEITNGEEYLNALNWALKNKRIKNIALAGPYGAGKSSIIETYLKRHKSISLFVFQWRHLLKMKKMRVGIHKGF